MNIVHSQPALIPRSSVLCKASQRAPVNAADSHKPGLIAPACSKRFFWFVGRSQNGASKWRLLSSVLSPHHLSQTMGPAPALILPKHR